MVNVSTETSEPVAAGQQALTAGSWELARRLFQAALDHEVTPEALEGLGTAMFWLDDVATIETRERAYRMYQAAGRRGDAARVATALVWDHVAFRGEDVVAKGWLERAGQLLEEFDTMPEHGWLAIQQADFAILIGGDAEEAQRAAEQAIEIGRALGDSDLELVGQALLGLAMVSLGRVSEGMRCLDASAAAAVAGDIRDVAWACYTCCYLLWACEVVRDYSRSAQWCEKASELCKRWRFEGQLHICRYHYASLLLEKGDWAAAETEMLSAASGLEETRPAIAVIAVVGLAELRRRQGRLDEAGDLVASALPFPPAMLAQAALALDTGDAREAAAGAERFLRQISPGDRAARLGGVELLVHARSALGDAAGAEDALIELEEIAAVLDTAPIRAAAHLGRAATAFAAGDFAGARREAEDAVDAFDRAGAPFGAAEARLLLANVLASSGEAGAVQREASAAARAFEHLGAARQAQVAQQLISSAPSATSSLSPPAEPPSEAEPASPLTRREMEVLRLVAAGKSNPEMARELVLSEHTVHRHVANILTKMGTPTRAAAIARASALGLL